MGPVVSIVASIVPHGTFVVAHTPASMVFLDVGTGQGAELPWAAGSAARVSWDVPGVMLCACGKHVGYKPNVEDVATFWKHELNMHAHCILVDDDLNTIHQCFCV